MPLLSCRTVAKAHGGRRLFKEISLGIEPGERIGLIGPNGSGKSTLMKILSGIEKPDTGDVSITKGTRIAYIAQDDLFSGDATVENVLQEALDGQPLDDDERQFRVNRTLNRVGFSDEMAYGSTANLSGGWKKRLSIACAIITEPDLLMLDEPTNHLDLEGVLWLENLLNNAAFGSLFISHDRYFLENVAKRVIELSAAYPEGFLSANGTYTDFLMVRETFLAGQAHREVALASQARREIEWLHRGAKARTTKAKGRIEAAGELLGEFAEVKARNRENRSVDLAFSASGRGTKELVVAQGIEKRMGGRTLFQDLDLTLERGNKLGLIGTNGAGKTTLIRILTGDLEPDGGKIRRANDLRIVYFDQTRTHLDMKVTLRNALSPNSDNIVYQGNTVHVSGWAKRFLFRSDQLEMPVSALSGGERSRILLSRMMLQPADLLILDEPTNDLDIPSLDVLEESLSDFTGALVLVTHDRYLLDRVSTNVLALDGNGGYGFFADTAQWEAFFAAKGNSKETTSPNKKSANPPTLKKSAEQVKQTVPLQKLSTSEKRELKEIEAAIHAAEEKVAEIERQMNLPTVATDAARLKELWDELPIAKLSVEQLYARWEDLEARRAAGG